MAKVANNLEQSGKGFINKAETARIARATLSLRSFLQHWG